MDTTTGFEIIFLLLFVVYLFLLFVVLNYLNKFKNTRTQFKDAYNLVGASIIISIIAFVLFIVIAFFPCASWAFGVLGVLVFITLAILLILAYQKIVRDDGNNVSQDLKNASTILVLHIFLSFLFVFAFIFLIVYGFYYADKTCGINALLAKEKEEECETVCTENVVKSTQPSYYQRYETQRYQPPCYSTDYQVNPYQPKCVTEPSIQSYPPSCPSPVQSCQSPVQSYTPSYQLQSYSTYRPPCSPIYPEPYVESSCLPSYSCPKAPLITSPTRYVETDLAVGKSCSKVCKKR